MVCFSGLYSGGIAGRWTAWSRLARAGTRRCLLRNITRADPGSFWVQQYRGRIFLDRGASRVLVAGPRIAQLAERAFGGRCERACVANQGDGGALLAYHCGGSLSHTAATTQRKGSVAYCRRRVPFHAAEYGAVCAESTAYGKSVWLAFCGGGQPPEVSR